MKTLKRTICMLAILLSMEHLFIWILHAMYFGVYENVKNQLHFIFIYELHGGNARPRHHQANDGKLSGSMGFDSDGELVCTDKTIIYAINFGVPNTGIEPPSKIKFKVEGEEMYYNISKSEWESNSDK